MSENSITFVDDLVPLVKKRYPDWKSFNDPTFVEEEIEYKKQASKKALNLLDEQGLEELFRVGKFNEIISRFKSIGQSSNLLFLSVPQEGDLYLLNQESRFDEQISRALIELLHSSSDVHSRLENYFSFLEKNNFKIKWTLPTYFLFLYYPEDEIFIKPSVTKWFFDFVDSKVRYSSKPSLDLYKAFRDYAYQIREELSNLGATTMIDIQSLIYVAFSERPSKKERPYAGPTTKTNTNSGTKFKLKMERWLQDFLFDNWDNIEEFQDWEIYEDGNSVGYEFNTNEVGQIDLLAKHKMEPRWLVVELKRDQSSDTTLGQVQRYMGWVKKKLARSNEQVEGMIIADSMQEKLLYAVEVTSDVSLFRYEMDLRLISETK